MRRPARFAVESRFLALIIEQEVLRRRGSKILKIKQKQKKKIQTKLATETYTPSIDQTAKQSGRTANRICVLCLYFGIPSLGPVEFSGSAVDNQVKFFEEDGGSQCRDIRFVAILLSSMQRRNCQSFTRN